MAWGISSVGRALGSQSRGQGFDPPILHKKVRQACRTFFVEYPAPLIRGKGFPRTASPSPFCRPSASDSGLTELYYRGRQRVLPPAKAQPQQDAPAHPVPAQREARMEAETVAGPAVAGRHEQQSGKMLSLQYGVLEELRIYAGAAGGIGCGSRVRTGVGRGDGCGAAGRRRVPGRGIRADRAAGGIQHVVGSQLQHVDVV